VRRRIREAFSRADDGAERCHPAVPSTSTSSRIEPSLAHVALGSMVFPRNPRRGEAGGPDDGYEPPLEVHARIASEVAAAISALRRRWAMTAQRAPHCGSETHAAARSRYRMHRDAAAGAAGCGGRARRRLACAMGRPCAGSAERGPGLPWRC
jgi:hypothetical protein